MALGKYQRIDNRRPSTSYCSTVTIVVFVGLCLVGVWMMTSSSVVPVQNVDVPQENKSAVNEQVTTENNNDNKVSDQVTENEVAEQITENNESSSSQFEDNPGDLPNDATKGATNSPSEQKQEETVESNSEQKGGSEGDLNSQENQEQKQEEQVEVKPEQNNSEGDSNSQESQEQKQEDQVELKPEKNDSSEGESTSQEGQEQQQEITELKGSSGNDSESQEQKQEEKVTENQDSSEESTQSGDGDTKTESSESNSESEEKKNDSEKGGNENKSESDDAGKKSDLNVSENNQEQSSNETKIEEKIDQNENKSTDLSTDKDDKAKDQSPSEVFPSGAQSELLKETTTQNGSFPTQLAEAKHEKESQQSPKGKTNYNWKLCNVTAGPDYIPCLDNWEAIHHLKTTKHYEHRERHCPENPPTCLVSLPEGYKRPIDWPRSREKIWYYNVPHTKLAEVKGHQNWVKVTGEYLTFPGGGTQFKHGALHYIDFIQESVPDIAWGNRSRVVLDVGCGVASFGGFLFDRDVLTMSLAPKDEHEAQVQFALERGIPAISSVMGTIRLPFPGKVFDVVHCARCRVPWHIEGGKLLLELNRVLRPGGFFIWSATPVYQKLGEDVEIWKAMSELTKAMCWDLVSVNKDKVNRVGVATYRKPTNNECYEKRAKPEPPLCEESDDPNAAWNVTLKACMHRIPTNTTERGSQWTEKWPARLESPPYWLLSSQVGVYGKAAPEDFAVDYDHWKRVIRNSYLTGIGLDWSNVRNVMDMRAVYGGLAAALRDLNVWVMNVVNINAPDTLPIIYERGLFGIYHDWCESFSTYPRAYDLLHADHLFSQIKKRCNLVPVVVEVDRILRPEGSLIVRDDAEIIDELETLFRSMQWEVRMTFSKDKEGLLCVQKSRWRPSESETISYGIA